MLPIQPMVNPFSVRIQIIDYHIRIARVACSEKDNLEEFAEVFQEFFGVGTDVDPSLNDFACRELYRQFDIIRRVKSIIAMNQGLI